MRRAPYHPLVFTFFAMAARDERQPIDRTPHVLRCGALQDRPGRQHHAASRARRSAPMAFHKRLRLGPRLDTLFRINVLRLWHPYGSATKRQPHERRETPTETYSTR